MHVKNMTCQVFYGFFRGGNNRNSFPFSPCFYVIHRRCINIIFLFVYLSVLFVCFLLLCFFVRLFVLFCFSVGWLVGLHVLVMFLRNTPQLCLTALTNSFS